MNKLKVLSIFLIAGVTALILFPRLLQAQNTQPVQNDSDLLRSSSGEPEEYADAPFAAGQIIVGVQRSSGSGSVAASGLLAQLDVVLAAQITASIDLRGLDGAEGDAGVEGYLLEVPEGSEWTAVEMLAGKPGIAFAHPNWIVYAADEPGAEEGVRGEGTVGATTETPFIVNDPLYVDKLWYLQRVQASRAWSLAERSTESAQESIRVAVIDSGVAIDHPDLKPQLLAGKNYLSLGEPPVDDYGHGTHIAGVIATTLNNEEGQSGLAPWVEIDARKVLDSKGLGSISNLATAIREAVDEGAKIVNLSVQTTADSATLKAAIQYAATQGALIVAAAGNCVTTDCPVLYPGAYDEAMAVAATGYANRRAYYSPKGDQVEIAAPGGEGKSVSSKQIFSAWSVVAKSECHAASGDYQIVNGGAYCNDSGTSMAAAVVSGVAALVWSFDPDMSAAEVRALLNSTAAPLPYTSSVVGSGLVDAHAAIRSLLMPELTPSTNELGYILSPGASPFSTTVTLQNPSSRTIAWSAELTGESDWIRLVSEEGFPVDGLAAYGAPAYITLEIAPQQLVTGSYSIDLDVIGERPDLSLIQHTIPISLLVDQTIHTFYFPMVIMDEEGELEPVRTSAFRWEVPNEDGREVRTLTDSSNIGVSLPFEFPLRGDSYTDLRLYSDGYAVFPAEDSSLFESNVCPMDVEWPRQAIFGWWADLDPSKLGAQISLFQTDEEHFVIEFHRVPAAIDAGSSYSVSFQIVLQKDGDFYLNYLTVPEQIGAPPRTTIGAKAMDGRFRNRIFCAGADGDYGALPQSQQSFLFTPEDLY